MDISDSALVESTLQKPDLHRQWKEIFRNAENEKFYQEAFHYIANVLNAPGNSKLLDAGCGTCAHSIRLAQHGFSVTAVDFSDYVLEKAKLGIRSSNVADGIVLQRENILNLSFPDETFDYILCWGVLMHIPDIEKAISELNRVLKNGGMIVISEVNMFSLQSTIVRFLRLLQKGKRPTKKTSAGLEYWRITPAGKILTRHTNVGWLKKKLGEDGFFVRKHVAGQFTELYHISHYRFVRDLIHRFNLLWFKFVKIPHFSFGNIVIVQKQRDIA
jgi:ubiquinone/menaquinone biosynthesis C-methylase UbiE